MTDAEKWTIFVSLVTLLFTVCGWLYTASAQKRLLEMQLEANKERDARQLYIPQRVERLRELRDWFEEGMALLNMRKQSIAGIEARYHLWQSKYTKLETQFLETDLAQKISIFYAFVYASLDEAVEPLDNGDVRYLNHATKTFAAASQMIDEFMEQTAASKR